MRTASRASAILFLSLGFSPASVSQTYSYRLTEVKPAAGSANGIAINNSGHITGAATQCNTETCTTQAFLWLGGKTFKYFGPIENATFFRGDDVNYLGQLTGLAETSTGQQAYFWDGATEKLLGTLGGKGSWGHAINGAGQIAGESTTESGGTHAFLWDGVQMRDLGTLGGVYDDFSAAHGINAKGHVTGMAVNAKEKFHVFLWNGTAMLDLSTLGGATSIGMEVNAKDQVVGSSRTKLGPFHAFLWQNGLMQDLGTLDLRALGFNTFGDYWSTGAAINNSGQIVGLSGDDATSVPFLWENGKMTYVYNLIAATDPLKPFFGAFAEVRDINNVGQMVAGTSPSFLLSPAYKLSAFIKPTLTSWRRGSTVRIAIKALDAKGVRIPDERAKFLLAEPGCRVKVSATGAQSLASTCMKYNATANEFWFDWQLAGTGTGTATIDARVNYGAPGPLKVRKTRNISVTN